MKSFLLAQIRMKETIIKNLDTERSNYIKLSMSDIGNADYFVRKANKLSLEIKQKQAELDKIKKQLENSYLYRPLKTRKVGIEMRDNSL